MLPGFVVNNHIENRRLFDFAAGTTKLEESQRQHLQKCELCQSVLTVFIRQPIDKSELGDWKSESD